MRGYFQRLGGFDRGLGGGWTYLCVVFDGLQVCTVENSHLNGSLGLMSSQKNKRRKRNQEPPPIVPSRLDPPIYIRDQPLVLPPGSNLVLRQANPSPIAPRRALYDS